MNRKHRVVPRVLLVFASLLSATALSAERIIQIEEFDSLANRTAAFSPGVTLAETRCGITCLHLAGEAGVSAHWDYFRFAASPKEKSWTLLFRFRPEGADPHEFALRLCFGDRSKPETRLLTVREAGSFFEGGAKPAAPKEGAPGFLDDWTRAAITVSGTSATFWVYRGGRLVAEAKGSFPTKPLVGWNLVSTAPKTNLSFDRLILVDGVERPYERGDLTDVIAQAAKGVERTTSTQQQGGVALEVGKPFATELKDRELTIRFKSTFAKDGKPASAGFTVDLGGAKPETLTFGLGDTKGKATYRVFAGGKFVTKSFPCVATNGVLTVGRCRYYAVPPLEDEMAYLTPEIAELAAAHAVFPRPNARVYALTLRPDGAGLCRVLLDGSLLATWKMPKSAVSVTMTGAATEATARVSACAVQGAETWPLAVPDGGFRLERCRENLGSYALECNEYLSRNAFRWMPSSCLWNVPRKQWYRAKVTCRIDPSAPKEFVPVVTARLTHFQPGCGRTQAVLDVPVDLSKPDARVARKGDLYEVTFDFDVGQIMDLTSLVDGLSHRELPYLNFELVGPLWEKNTYYLDSRRAPAEDLRSSVIVLGGELYEAPAYLKAVSKRPYSLWYPNETPQADVTVKPLDGGAYAFAAIVTDDWGREVGRVTLPVGAGFEKTVDLPKDLPYGHYNVRYAVTDAKGALVQKHDAMYGLLPTDDREAGYDSPYYSWNFNGSHGTVRDPKDWLPAYKFLGYHYTMMPHGSWETNEMYAAQKVTHAQAPYIRVNPGQEEQAKARMRDYLRRYPHCRRALIFHEAGGGPFPKEAFGGVTELDDWARRHQADRVAQATRAAKCWREVDLGVKLIVGNGGESYGLVAELMRGGLRKDYVDCWGEESVGLTMAPEMSTAFTPWILRKVARHYGYTERMDAPFEWKNRTERYERSFRGAAALNIRDALISHVLGYETIPLEIGTEVANSYADTIWDVCTFTRWPLAYPSENAVSIATLTRVLDRAKFVRRVPTGTLTGYALEFAGKNGKWVYALWTARGETTATIGWKGGTKVLGLFDWNPDYLHVGMTGFETETDSPTVEVLDEPGYLVTEKPIESFAFAPKRTFRHENADRFVRNRTVDALARASDVEVVCAEDVRIDPKYQDAPHRPGRFAVRDATDDEKGACLEVEHLSQKECPEIMMEYCLLKLKNPKTVEKPFDTLGVWAKGNSNWGKLSFELTDAEGEVWFTAGMGGCGCYVYDWPAKLSLNYDGWHFIQVPVTDKSEVRIVGPGMNRWMWTRDAKGNGKIDWPVKVTAIGFSQMGRTLDLVEMKSTSPTVRLGKIEVR